MTRKPTIARDDGATTHERLVEAATILFRDKGYDATSVSDIVELAELTKGAFYHRYSSKVDCLRELHSRFIEGELSRLETAVAQATDPEDAVRAIIRSFLHGVRYQQATQRIFDQEWRHLQTEGFEAIRRQRDKILTIVVDQIRLGVASGVFRPEADPQIMALGIIGMSGWAHRWFRPDGPLSDEQIADLWARIVLDGLMSDQQGRL